METWEDLHDTLKISPVLGSFPPQIGKRRAIREQSRFCTGNYCALVALEPSSILYSARLQQSNSTGSLERKGAYPQPRITLTGSSLLNCLGPRKRWTSAYKTSEITVSPERGWDTSNFSLSPKEVQFKAKEVEILPSQIKGGWNPSKSKHGGWTPPVTAKEVEILPTQGKRQLKLRQAQAKPTQRGWKSSEVEIPPHRRRANSAVTLLRSWSKLNKGV